MCVSELKVIASPSFVWFVLAVTSAMGESARSASRGSECEFNIVPFTNMNSRTVAYHHGDEVHVVTGPPIKQQRPCVC